MDTDRKAAAGLRGEDQQQGDLRDTRGGTYGVTPSSRPRVEEQRTAHQDAQHGADVRPEPVVTGAGLPEGLARERKGPLNPSSGRRSPRSARDPN